MEQKRNTQSGATLVELITWMALSSFLLIAVGGIFFSASKLWNYGNQQYDVQQTARLVMNVLANDLRYGNSQVSVGFEAAPTGSVNANPHQSIMFTSHKDGEHTIIYYLDKDNKQLYKVINGAYSSPELVLGSTNHSGIYFISPPTNEKIFDILPAIDDKNTRVTINLVVMTLKGHKLPINQTDINAAIKENKTFTLQTTVTLLDSCLNNSLNGGG